MLEAGLDDIHFSNDFLGALFEKSTNEIIMAELVKKFINQVLIKLKAIQHLTAFNQEEAL